MEQRGDLARHSVERFGLVDMHDDARTEDRIDRVTETRARAGVEDDHAATRPIEPAKAEKPANSASAPLASSLRSISLHLAIRSERVQLPRLSWPASTHVARCSTVTSAPTPHPPQ